MKKVFALILALGMTLALLAGCGSSDSGDGAGSATLKVGMIAESFGTQSYNDDVKAGLELCKSELGIEYMDLEVPQITDAASGLNTLIGQGCNFLIVPSGSYKDGMLEVATANPDVKFLYLAEALEGYDNIMSISYRENEGSFMAGVVGGLMTQTNNVGCVMGNNEALQVRYQAGFTAGAKYVNPDCEVQSAFTNSYSDVNKGYEIANLMYSKGADFVGTYSGAGNLGVFQAADEAGEGKYCFGAANGQFDKMPEKILASVVKPVDQALLTILGEYQESGTFTSGVRAMGLKENGVTLLFTNNEALKSTIPADVMSKVEDIIAKVEAGEIEIPTTMEEAAAFTDTYAG